MMYPLISVNIPVYNEEKQIQNTLESVLNQDYPGELEIKVCANGCTDRTEEKVLQVAEMYGGIELISLEEKGKPNAWNKLRESSSSNYQVFMDGDVILEYDALKELYSYLIKNPELAAVGSFKIAHPSSESFFDRLVVNGCGISSTLSGVLYMINNSKVSEILDLKGYGPMPKNVIHDDVWLSFVLGKENIGFEKDSIVHYTYPGWKDLLKRNSRHAKGNIQILQDNPELVGERENFREFVNREIRNLKGKSLVNKLGKVSSYFIQLPIKKYYKIKYSAFGFDDDPIYWETTDSSKIPFMLGKKNRG